MMRRALFAIVCALTPAILPIVGCEAPQTPTADEVLSLAVCPKDTPCAKVADGASQITVQGCIASEVDEPRRDLMAEFRISDGAFIDPLPLVNNPKIARVPLTNRCAIARFRTPSDPQMLRVQLQLLTSTTEENPPADSYLPYSQAQQLAIEPAPISFVTFGLPGTTFTELTPSFEIDTIVRTLVGNPSNGTQVELSITPKDLARITPDKGTVGAASTSFRAIIVPGTASTITITAIATPPSSSAGVAVSPVSSSITLVRSVPPPTPP
jgi:hypothetical protein